MEFLFNLSNFLVLPFWLLIIIFPHWQLTKRLMQGFWSVIIPALLYAGMVIPQLPGVISALSNPSLATIAELMATPQGATVAWAHFLAFDLFVGRWVYLDSREHNVIARLVSPMLFLVFMVGPLGLLAYLLVRTLWLRAHNGNVKPV